MDKIQTIEKLFYYIVACSYLILPICLFSKKIRKKGVIPVILGIYGIFCFLALIIFKEALPKEYRNYYYILYTTFEYLIFAFIFLNFISSKKIKNLIIVLSLLYILFQVFYVLWAENNIMLDTVPIGIETILIFTFIGYSLFEFSKNFSGQNVYNNYIFWIAVGVLIYLGGSFFFYLTIDQLDKAERDTFGNLTYFAEIIKNILFLIALFIYSRFNFNKPEKNSNSIPYLDMI